MKCGKCKEEVKEVYKCDGCNTAICKTCGALTSSETKVMQLNSRVMKFFCTKCDKSDVFTMFQEIITMKEQLNESNGKIIESKDKIIASNEELIMLLRNEIEELKGKSSQENIKMSYNSAVKKNLSSEVLVVKPKIVQASSATRQVIEDKINPTTLGVGINRIKYVREGGVAISCNRQDIKNISENMQQRLGEEYEINIPEKRNPKIKIFNIQKKLLDDPE